MREVLTGVNPGLGAWLEGWEGKTAEAKAQAWQDLEFDVQSSWSKAGLREGPPQEAEQGIREGPRAKYLYLSRVAGNTPEAPAHQPNHTSTFLAAEPVPLVGLPDARGGLFGANGGIAGQLSAAAAAAAGRAAPGTIAVAAAERAAQLEQQQRLLLQQIEEQEKQIQQQRQQQLSQSGLFGSSAARAGGAVMARPPSGRH